MKVMELRAALASMPGEMNVYLLGGSGVKSAQHIFALNLVRVDQFCELITYEQEHTEDMLDSKIERETGFKNRDDLIAAYKRALAAIAAQDEVTA